MYGLRSRLNTLTVLCPVLIFLALAPCAESADKPQPGVYNVGYDLVYDKCMLALGQLGWNVTGFDKANGIITGKTGISASTFGDELSVVISRTSSDTVTVILSSTTPGQLITYGKNKRNKKKFYKLLDELIAKAEASGEVKTQSQSEAETSEELKATGSGFFITKDGYLLTNYHVVEGGKRFSVYVGDKEFSATLVHGDESNDIALLKVEAKVDAVPIIESQAVQLAAEVFTIGFPMPGSQGLSPKFTRGEISSMFGWQDDVRFFQISTPIQPGNSGGALFDEDGNVIGITTATENSLQRLQNTGTTPQNVNYALKGDYIIAFLKSFPKVYSSLEARQDRDQSKRSEVVAEVLKSAVLVARY